MRNSMGNLSRDLVQQVKAVKKQVQDRIASRRKFINSNKPKIKSQHAMNKKRG